MGYEEIYKSMTDKELIAITTVQREQFHPEAIAAADKELASRGLNEETFQILEEKEQQEYTHRLANKDEAELIALRGLAIAIPCMGTVIIFIILAVKGKLALMKDYIMYSLIGIAIWTGLGVVYRILTTLF